MLAGNSKLVRGLPAEQDRRGVILAVVRIDLIGVLGAEPDAIGHATQLMFSEIATAARSSLGRRKDVTGPACVLVFVGLLRRPDGRAAIALRVSATIC